MAESKSWASIEEDRPLASTKGLPMRSVPLNGRPFECEGANWQLSFPAHPQRGSVNKDVNATCCRKVEMGSG